MTNAGIAFRATHHRPVFTSAEAADVRGVSFHSGAKALIVKAGDEHVMAVLPADMALDSGELRRQLKCKRMRFATKDEVQVLTGLEPGAIPPFGSLFEIHTVCDERLAENEHINFNAGSHTDSFQMTYQAYFDFESPTIGRFAKPITDQ